MNEYSFYPPEETPYTDQLMSELADLIQHIRYSRSGTSLYSEEVLYSLLDLFDQETIDLLYKLSEIEALDGLVHIYKNRTHEVPTITLMRKPSFLRVHRNV